MHIRTIIKQLLALITHDPIGLIRDLWIALRPLSLSLAVASTTTGILLAKREGAFIGQTPSRIWLLIAMVTFAGLLAQSGANLINDYFEGSFLYRRFEKQTLLFLGAHRSAFDILVFLTGIGCLLLAACIGIVLMIITHATLFFIGLAGLIGAYAYTGEPFVYKRHGLGVPLSFVLMGPLMVYGAYHVFDPGFHTSILIYSLPISVWIPAMMLSNEMRDLKRDQHLMLGTFAVKSGGTIGKALYMALVLTSYVLPAVLIWQGSLSPTALFIYATVPLSYRAVQSVFTHQGLGIPRTNLCHLTYSAIYLIALSIV